MGWGWASTFDKLQRCRISDCADYSDVSNYIEDSYRAKLNRITLQCREKYPQNLRKNYKHEVARLLKLNVKTPQINEKLRNDCVTTETIHYFFDNTYNEKMCTGVPPQLCFNADETSVEVGDPKKIIIPAEEKEGRKINKFKASSHISALIVINAVGDDINHFVIVPLKNLPRDLTPLVVGQKINIVGSQNGWIDDNCFFNWAKKIVIRVNEIREIYNFDKHQKAILFLDGHGTRNNREIMNLFKSENIEVIIFPPHLTHLLQPFDRVVSRPLKDALSRIASQIINEIDEDRF